MVGSRLRDVMLAAVGAGELEGAAVRRGAAEHPICGDRVELTVRLDDDVVADLRWLAEGCPATMAVAALTSTTLVGSPVAACDAALQRAIADHGGLAAHERHAEGLVLRAFKAACTN